MLQVGYCSTAGECEGECNTDSDCSSPACSECQAWLCSHPECCRDEDCPISAPHCSDNHCVHVDINGIVNITVSTETCSDCEGSGNPLGYVS